MTTKFGNQNKYPKKRKLRHYFSPVGLPWWLSGKESACHCSRHEFRPWSGRIPYTTERLNPYTTTAEPVLHSPGATAAEGSVPWSPCFATGEAAPARGSHTAIGERPRLSATRGESAQP